MAHLDQHDGATAAAGTGAPATPAGTSGGRGGRPHAPGTRTFAAVTAIALGCVALTACGGGGTSKNADGTTTVTIGIAGNIFDVPIKLAEANGYFSKQGIKVKYVTLTASTGASALESGSVQFLNDSPTDFLSAVGKKIPETAIAADGGGNPLGLIVSTKFAKAHGLTADTPAAQVAKALDGSTGGSSSANTKGEASVYLKAYGVDAGKVKWVSLPSPAADKAALKSNQIDWFVTSQPSPLEIQDSGDGVVVADSIKVPAWSSAQAGYGQFVVGRNSYLSQHADIAGKVATAVQQATAYMNAHLDSATVQTVAQKALPGVPAAVIKTALPQVEWPKSGEMTDGEWTKTLAFINSLGALTKQAQVSSDDWTNKYLK
ncbi:ABC transporter substrate-binding protein [Streptomyces sp. NBC_00669]|uniref:ABC transporter substrate-binding protein n=1 Tax=unclassified Streptomyces TaxID=2593676 RepID=UPI002E350C71|nr:ABC transporter substrate-binding protein [Streptomyces sp. NBC_00669]